MNTKCFSVIIITGASGFIGGALSTYLFKIKSSNLVLVDFSLPNNTELKDCNFIYTDNIFSFLDQEKKKVSCIIHLGAITDTTETDINLFNQYNFIYTKNIWSRCVKYSIPLIYASSAATYGNGKFGFSDNHEIIKLLTPLNLYAKSKNDFDKYVLGQNKKPPFWCGLKFFNVFGFDESKKGKMSSIVFQSFLRIKKTNEMLLFKSKDSNFKNGEQCRDFIYIKDVIDVIAFFCKNRNQSGIYNLGTGHSTTYFDLINLVFKSMNKEMRINYIDMPLELENRYQYYTQADISKLRASGYSKPFTTIETAVDEYITKYLI